MAKRLYSVAKEIGVTPKELIERLSEQGVEVKSHLSTLTPEAEDLARSLSAGKTKHAPGKAVQSPSPTRKTKKTAKRTAARKKTASKKKPGLFHKDRIDQLEKELDKLEDLSRDISGMLNRRRERALQMLASASTAETATGVLEKPKVTPGAPKPAGPPETPTTAKEQATTVPPQQPPAPPAGEKPEAPAPAAQAPAEAQPEAKQAPAEKEKEEDKTQAAPSEPETTEKPPAEQKQAPSPPKAPEEPQKRKRKRGKRRVITMDGRLAGPKPLVTKPATGLRRTRGEKPGKAPPESQPPRAAGTGAAPAAPGKEPFTKKAPAEKPKKGKRRTRFFPTHKEKLEQQAETRRRHLAKPKHKPKPAEIQRPEKIEVRPPITVKDFSIISGIRQAEIIKFFLMQNTIIKANSHLSEEALEDLSIHFDIEINLRKEEDVEAPLRAIENVQDPGDKLVPRAPVVTFLGHVDHGKTSILDYIRKANVHEREAGGITQAVSAYRIDLPQLSVTFVDTPGHAAFTQMRARGAQVTDIAVLVVAADDGPMPQTEEAITHIQEAGVGLVVAVNKCDLPAANPLRAKQRLSEFNLVPPEWGGDTEMVEVSAVSGQGIDDLLETLHLMGEMKGLKANPARNAYGLCLESRSSKGRGILADVLIQNGTLRVGDYVLCGHAHGKVRALKSMTTGKSIPEAGPSTPVEVMGLSQIPEAGDRFYVLEDSQQASSIAEERASRRREEDRAKREETIGLENFLEKLSASEEKELRLILKTDVNGSAEAIQKQIMELGTEEVSVKLLRSAVGMISEGDVSLAEASKAIVLGFNVKVDDRARKLAEERGVQIRIYDIIYELVEEVRAGLEDRLSPVYEEVTTGSAVIRQIFKVSRLGNIAGCYVQEGTINRSDRVRVKRDGQVLHEGPMASLRREKDDAKSVRQGLECGIKLAKFEDIQEGDVLECYRVESKRRTL